MANDWALLTAGKKEDFNTMTIGWLTEGIIWGKNVLTCYVRSSRHTYSFMEEYDHFTVSFYDNCYKKDLAYLGAVSGRSENKVEKVGFNPLEVTNSVTFKEARMTILCKKIYYQDMDSTKLHDFGIEKYYPRGDYHRFYIGEIEKIYIKD